MTHNKINLKEGITLHLIDTKKFKTNLISVFLSTKLTRKYVTYNSLVSAVLRRGSTNYKTQENISKKLEEMYGAAFDCGINKTGDNHILKFYLESINDNFLPQNHENILEESINMLFDIIFNPYTENGSFKDEYINQEKQNIKQIIESKIDNKATYAQFRCVEEMYKEKPTGLYRFGYVEDLDKISNQDLYEYYKKLISECKIDIFVSGDINLENITKMIENNKSMKNINSRQADYNKFNLDLKEKMNSKYVIEKMDVNQGKLVIGCDILFNKEELKDENIKYQAMLYNSLLGGSANSKLFQNVREKASLAYTASSGFIRNKNNIMITAGIEIANYKKTVEIIQEQIESMKRGDFTDDEIENEKRNIISQINLIDDEQDTELIYIFNQELNNENVGIEKYKEKIQNVTRDQIINVAKKININTIFFLSSKNS